MSTYNRADLLPQALDCLLAQTRVPDEIIVVDDGSTDNTPEVLARYGRPVIAIRQENQGLGAGRNTAWHASSGECIAFLDSDDLITPDSIEKRVCYLEAHPDLNLVYSGAYMTTMEGKVLGWFRMPPLPRGHLFPELILRHAFPVHAVMMRRRAVLTHDLFDRSLPSHEDWDLWVRLARENAFEAIDEPLAHYRVHDGMMSANLRHKGLAYAVQVQERILHMPEFQALSSSQQAVFYLKCGTHHLHLNQLNEAREFYIRAIRAAPANLRPYLFWSISWLGQRGYHLLLDSYQKIRHLFK